LADHDGEENFINGPMVMAMMVMVATMVMETRKMIKTMSPTTTTKRRL